MDEQTSGTQRTAAGAQITAAELALQMRGILSSKDFETEERRKAALRRTIHESVVGLKEEELVVFLDELRRRFPDRALDASLRSRHLKAEASSLRADLDRIRKQRNQLRERMEEHEAILVSLRQWVCALPETEFDAASASRFFLTLRMLVDFMEQLDQVFEIVDGSLRGRRDAAQPAVGARQLLARYAAGGETAGEDLKELSRRLDRLKLLPEVLLRAAEQSWKGTADVLDQLDPKSVEAGGKIFKKGAILDECGRRFDEFRDQLEQNIEHYYRQRFQQVYVGKMEERS